MYTPRSCRSGHGPFDWRNEATIIALPPETASDARKLSEAALPIAMMKQAPAPTACTAVRQLLLENTTEEPCAPESTRFAVRFGQSRLLAPAAQAFGRVLEAGQKAFDVAEQREIAGRRRGLHHRRLEPIVGIGNV
jgi:hypothetical protein